MPEIKVTQTYNIDIARKVTVIIRNNVFKYKDDYFESRISKVEADGITVKMYDDGTAQATIKATTYLNVHELNVDDEIATVKATFTITLNKVKISDLKGIFISEPGDISGLDLDINFNSDVPRNAQKFIADNLAKIIHNKSYEGNVEQTTSKVEYTEK